MKNTLKNVALDLHQATVMALVQDARGRRIDETVLPTEERALLQYFGGMRGPIHVIFEEGTQAQWLHDLLLPVVDRVVVCDRRGQGRQGNKNDRVDAARLQAILRAGTYRAVYHGAGLDRSALRELARAYQNAVEDCTRAMLRLKALFRARAIRTPGRGIYGRAEREKWLAVLPDAGVRLRAETLYTQLDVLRELRPRIKAAMIAEARRDPAYAVLRTVPFLGPVRVATLLATMQTPWRFPTKRNLWAYAGLAVVTHSSADHEFVAGRPVRRRRAPLTRGLNRNHNRILKDVFKSAATAAASRPGALRDFHDAMIARGMRAELARVTLARKIAALTLRLWKTGERYDPAMLSTQVT
jgi:transposase